MQCLRVFSDYLYGYLGKLWLLEPGMVFGLARALVPLTRPCTRTQACERAHGNILAILTASQQNPHQMCFCGAQPTSRQSAPNFCLLSANVLLHFMILLPFLFNRPVGRKKQVGLKRLLLESTVGVKLCNSAEVIPKLQPEVIPKLSKLSFGL